jgi:hypothetical protein
MKKSVILIQAKKDIEASYSDAEGNQEFYSIKKGELFAVASRGSDQYVVLDIDITPTKVLKPNLNKSDFKLIFETDSL